MFFKSVITACLSVTFAFSAYSQQLYLHCNGATYNSYESYLYSTKSNFHTSVKPFLVSEINEVINYDSLLNTENNEKTFKRKFPQWFWNKVFNENLIKVNADDFKLTIDPAVNFEYGKDLIDGNTGFVNTRGFWVNGSIGDKFSFSSNFYETQATFIDYISDYIKCNGIVPGQGYKKGFYSGFDYAMADGYISYTPSKYFNFQFGHGKNFWGDGYRSLMLSDNSFNYPFLKISTNIWKIKYVNLFTQFQDIREPHTYEMGFQKKYGSFHYLSWNISKRFNLNLFEGVIWQASDSSGTKGFEINYLNPVIFFRPVEFSLCSPNNSIIGLGMKYKISDQFCFYDQFVIDDCNLKKLSEGKGFIQNKFAFQFGIKGFNIFKIPNLGFQTEYNQVQPYTYAHKTPLQNYAHYNQPLAHPLGANFKESVSFLRYKYKRWSAEAKFMYAVYGADTSTSHWGKDIFKSDTAAQYGLHGFGNFNGQGLKTTLIYKDLKISYLLNPRTNMNIVLGISDRTETATESKHSTFVYIGIRAFLQNFYYDF